MNKKQKIQQALEAKGYIVTELSYEPIKYYGSGREGGWEIMIDDDIDGFPEEGWEALNKFCMANNIVADCGNGYIMCYTFEDAMKLIEQVPPFYPPPTCTNQIERDENKILHNYLHNSLA